jgi:hypothetical protein
VPSKHNWGCTQGHGLMQRVQRVHRGRDPGVTLAVAATAAVEQPIGAQHHEGSINTKKCTSMQIIQNILACLETVDTRTYLFAELAHRHQATGRHHEVGTAFV